jgi:ribonuclease P protein component
MKRQYRLRRPAHFQRVRSSGVYYDGASISLGVAPARQRTTRCGIVVAKRIGGAVVRNRIKRRIREVLRAHYDHMHPHYDVVCIARSAELATLAYPRLLQLVANLLRRAGVLVNPDAAPNSLKG